MRTSLRPKGEANMRSLLSQAPEQELTLLKKTIPVYTHSGIPGRPLPLSCFGYRFNERQELRMIADPRVGFKWMGEKHYDCLGDAVVEEIYSMMERQHGMRRVLLPLGQQQSPGTRSSPPAAGGLPEYPPPQVPIFISPNFHDAETVLVLMQGSGAVRAGMWARKLCTSDSLEKGSMLPMLALARERGWGIIITNPNENAPLCHNDIDIYMKPVYAASHSSYYLPDGSVRPPSEDPQVSALVERFWSEPKDNEWIEAVSALKKAARAGRSLGKSGMAQPVPGHSNPIEHTLNVFKNYITTERTKAKKAYFVCHSYGGACFCAAARDPAIFQWLKSHAVAVAFTDAVDTMVGPGFRPPPGLASPPLDDPGVLQFFASRVINWVATGSEANNGATADPVDTPLGRDKEHSTCLLLSAGHKEHIWTTASSSQSIWRWFDLCAENIEARKKKSLENFESVSLYASTFLSND